MSGQAVEVQAGDTIMSLAEAAGLVSWTTIWDHEENAELRELREDPGSLVPGDQVFVPEMETKQVEVENGAVHRFRLRHVPIYLELALEDGSGAPYRSCSYRLDFGDIVREGSTDVFGYLKRRIPAGVTEATLTLSPTDGRPSREWTLDLGHLVPTSEDTGVQGILKNLGFEAGDLDGELSDNEARLAILEFQEAVGLEPTGELDEATRAALES